MTFEQLQYRWTPDDAEVIREMVRRLGLAAVTTLLEQAGEELDIGPQLR